MAKSEARAVTVRAFAQDDLAAARALADRLRAADPGVEPFGPRLAELSAGPRALLPLWRVAEDRGGLLQGISFAALRDDSPARTSVEVYAAVMPEARRAGAGSRLLAPAIAWARERSRGVPRSGGAPRSEGAPKSEGAPGPERAPASEGAPGSEGSQPSADSARARVALRTRVPDTREARGSLLFLSALGFSPAGALLSLQRSGQRLPERRPEAELTVCPLDAADAGAVAAFAQLSDAAWRGSPEAFSPRADEAERAAAEPGRLILLASRGRAPAGYLSAIDLEASGATGGALAIEAVAVLPELRRRGIGRELVVAALHAVAGRCDAALLTVREDNLAARELYRSLRFEVSGRRLVFERAG